MQVLSALRSNARIAAGLAVIGGILWANALLDLSEANSALAATLRQKNVEVSRLEAQAREARWIERAQEMRDALAAVEARAWPGDSVAIARAGFQDWLGQQLTQAKLVRPIVKMAQTESPLAAPASAASELPEGLLRLRATVEFDTNPRAMQELLKVLATGERMVAVESLKLSRPRTEMAVVGWYSEPAAAKSETTRAGTPN